MGRVIVTSIVFLLAACGGAKKTTTNSTQGVSETKPPQIVQQESPTPEGLDPTDPADIDLAKATPPCPKKK